MQRLQDMHLEFGVSLNRALVPQVEGQLHQACPPEVREAYHPTSTQGGIVVSEALDNFVQSDQASMVLLALGGLGKSIATFNLAARLLQEMRQGKNGPLPQLLRSSASKWSHEALTGLGAGEERKDADAQLFIFDGYDELSGRHQGNLPAQLQLSGPDKLVVTCRPDAVPGTELQDRFATHKGSAKVHFLQPFTRLQMLDYLGKTDRLDGRGQGPLH